jgi:ABC-2 type transport system permease protein
LLEIDKNVLLNGRVVLYSQIVSDFSLNRRITSALNSAIVNLRLTNEGLQPEIIRRLMRGANVEIVKVGKEGMHKESGQTFFLAFLLMMILYVTLVGYGTSLMKSVIEEKMSRIVEVLISSLRPFQLMMGKIVGVSLVGLTQYVIWATCGILLFAYGDSLSRLFPWLPQFPPLPSVPFILFFYFIFYFMLGYLFYATLFAAVGALAGEEGDTQQLVFPILLPLIFPILTMVYIQAHPDAPNVVFMSMIPFFTPLVMMVRVIVSTPPLWQIIASIFIMIVAIVFTTYVAGRIYRIGILMYGKRPTISEIIKWIRKG